MRLVSVALALICLLVLSPSALGGMAGAAPLKAHPAGASDPWLVLAHAPLKACTPVCGTQDDGGIMCGTDVCGGGGGGGPSRVAVEHACQNLCHRPQACPTKNGHKPSATCYERCVTSCMKAVH
jgi:hypothetical protein